MEASTCNSCFPCPNSDSPYLAGVTHQETMISIRKKDLHIQENHEKLTRGIKQQFDKHQEGIGGKLYCTLARIK